MGEQILNVRYLPQEVPPEELVDSAVVVIDLLRATTTITEALSAGASEVVPCLEVADALAAREEGDGTEIILGGERGGLRIEGFDLGNSPAEYTPEVVGDKRVFITTTNGTRALDHARKAKRIVCGAIVNLSAVVESVRGEGRVEILCAGTDGEMTQEDILAAGAMVHLLVGGAESPTDTGVWRTNAQADHARNQWETLLAGARESGRTLRDELALALRDTAGGRNLLEIGHDGDLVDCADVDRRNVVGELDPRMWRITMR